MKLDTETAFEDLTALMRKMGARPVIWEPEPPIPIVIEIEVTPNSNPDVEKHLFSYPEGLIGAYGRQCLLYIPHIKSWRGVLQFPKFHFMECSTIKQMKKEGKFERYTVTNRTSGKFLVSENGKKSEVQLDVCKNCLSEYKPRKFYFHNFNIELFFKECKSIFETLPSTYDGNIPEDVYRKNWANITDVYRNNVGWCCEYCGVNLSNRPVLLHTHHRDGVKTNTDTRNLVALCKLCHTEQPQHGHMKITEEEKAFIIAIRKRNEENTRKFKDIR